MKRNKPIISVLVISFVVFFCLGSSFAASKKVFKLVYADQNPEVSWGSKHATEPFLKAVEKATNGRVKFERYYGQTLCKGRDAWEVNKNGVADVTWNWHGYWPGMTSLADVMTLPFMSFPSSEASSGMLWKLYEKIPALRAQFKDVKPLALWTTRPYFLITTKKQIKTIEDFKGMKIRVPGGAPTEMMKLLGGSPIAVPMPDTYINLEKGVMDGMGVLFASLNMFKQYEVVKYYTYVPLYASYFSLAMNINTWNKLPPDVQKQIESVSGFERSKFWGKQWYDESAKVTSGEIKKKDYEMVEYTIPQSEFSRWQKVAGKPVWDGWVAKTKAAGRPEAQEVLDTLLEMIKNYK
jgi:TRAP-type C4-dicarboxylate transport system substrate-binding protein